MDIVSQNVGNLISNLNKNELDKFYSENYYNDSNNIAISRPTKCNCQNRNLYKVRDYRRLESEVVYRASVSMLLRRYKYIGCSTPMLEKRITNHMNTFRNPDIRNLISLSKLIWKVKEDKIKYSIFWVIIGKARAYKVGNEKCQLCNLELLLILKSRYKTINNKIEIDFKCSHRAAKLFKNYKSVPP